MRMRENRCKCHLQESSAFTLIELLVLYSFA